MNSRTRIFAANWKMNRLVRESRDYVGRLTAQLAEIPQKAGTDYELVLCAPATHLAGLQSELANTPYKLGAQNCGTAKFGAFTGENSPATLVELGCQYVIVGHSERRHLFKEEDLMVLSRLKAAVEEGLKVIFCVGEILQERKAGKTFNRIETQLSVLKQPQFPANGFEKLVIAYEPVWAIGTGENASPAQAQEVHAFIRGWLLEKVSSKVASETPILYGGSVKPENAAQLMKEKDLDGFLVGGASLDPAAFAGVVRNGLKSVS